MRDDYYSENWYPSSPVWRAAALQQAYVLFTEMIDNMRRQK